MPAQEPQQFGEFAVLAKLGQGAMGAVYKARQTSLNRVVALKLLPAHYAGDPDFLARFKHEAMAAASLNHPNIVQVYAAGADAGTHFFAMEYVEGESLGSRLERKGRIDPREVIAVACYLAQALDYAWRKAQVIHRDIKPDNIFLSREGTVKLGDLGLAKVLGNQSGLTQTGAAMGTPYYVSPEQAMGVKEIDFRADIYSLGCTLYHALTGLPPYQGESAMSVMLQHVSQPPPKIQTAWPECPPPLIGLLDRMLAKRPEERHESYAALLHQLYRAAERLDQPTQSDAAAMSMVVPMPLPGSGSTPDVTRAAASAAQSMPAKVRARKLAAIIAVLAATVIVFLVWQPLKKYTPPVQTLATPPLPPNPPENTAPPATAPINPDAQPPPVQTLATPPPPPNPPENTVPPATAPTKLGDPNKAAASLPALERWIDALALVDLVKHSGPGSVWSRKAEGIQWESNYASPSYAGTFQLPVELTPSYAMETEFTCGTTLENVGILIPVGNGHITSCWFTHTGYAGIAKIDGRDAQEAGEPGKASPFLLQPNHRYLARAEIRRAPEGVDIQFLVDGRTVGAYRGSTLRLMASTYWQIGNENAHAMLGANKSVTFHSARVKALEDLRPMAEAKPPASADGEIAKHLRATKDEPFVNRLGMKFVPVSITGEKSGGREVLFSVWETREQDYGLFAKETSRAVSKPDFAQTPMHPAVMVSWDDAQAFCDWLTRREWSAGNLGATERYRLPTDHEWSCAAGIGDREDPARLPSAKEGGIAGVFPWGNAWPPPAGAGNFGGEECQAAMTAGKHPTLLRGVLTGYRDGYVETAPVGSFSANQFGLQDLSGNVWEFCEDWYDGRKTGRVLRGGSWHNRDQGNLSSSRRVVMAPGKTGISYCGFRCVLQLPPFVPAAEQPASRPKTPAEPPLPMPLPAAAAKPAPQAPVVPAEEFTSLFNGYDLTGWVGDKRWWSVNSKGDIEGRSGIATNPSQPSFLIWQGGTVSDFELRFSFDISSGNSGVQYRSTVSDRGKWSVSGYQFEIDPRSAWVPTGSLVDDPANKKWRLSPVGDKSIWTAGRTRTKVGSFVKKAPKSGWNDAVIIAKGNVLTHQLNGVTVLEVTDQDTANLAASGILALEIPSKSPTTVKFKDIRLKPLPKAP